MSKIKLQRIEKTPIHQA